MILFIGVHDEYNNNILLITPQGLVTCDLFDLPWADVGMSIDQYCGGEDGSRD